MRLVLLIVIAALVASACGFASPEPAPDPDSSLLTPGTVEAATPEMYQQTLRSFRGQPVVVNFWASWCDPCIEEMPRLVEASHVYSTRVQFFGVAVDDVQTEAEEFLRVFQVPFPSLGDPRSEIRRAEKVLGLPTTLFYRSDGRLAFAHAGEISAEQLEEKLQELVRVDGG